MADATLGEFHQPTVVRIGRIELHHREFGVVPRTHAFVAEIAVDFIDALEPADHQALEVKLGRDAQEHLHVERVVMRDERLGRRAARDRMQHRRFDFEEAVAVHVAADRGDDLAARDEGVARLGGHDQIDVALAVLELLIGQAVELVGQGAQRFREQAHFGALDRQLARLGLEHLAARRDDVADVPALEGVIGFFAHAVARHVKLDAALGAAARAVLDGREARLAHDPAQHHASGDRDIDVGFFEVLGAGGAMALMQLRRAVRGHEIVREGDPLGAQGREFFAPLGDQVVLVDFLAGGRGGFGHGRFLAPRAAHGVLQ